MSRVFLHFFVYCAIACVALFAATTAVLAQGAPSEGARETPVARLAERQDSTADQPTELEQTSDSSSDGESAEPTGDFPAPQTDDDHDRAAAPSENGPAAPASEPPATSRRPARPAVSPARTRLRAFDNVGPIEADDESTKSNMARPRRGEGAGAFTRGAVATAETNRPTVRIDRVALRDITPGISTVADVDAIWGTPVNDHTRLGSGKRYYEFAPFDEVVVELIEGNVVSIVAHLPRPAALSEIARQYLAGGVAESGDPTGAVELEDDRGQALGVAYPERGVVFGYAVEDRQVDQVLFEPIDAGLFLLRAERNQHKAPQQSLADLDYVLEKDPRNSAARLLAARIYFDAGQLTEASGAIDAALKIDANGAACLLTKAEILAESGDFTTSRETCERVLRLKEIAPEYKAKAQCLLGDCMANGPSRNYKQAIEYHLAALKTAQPFAESPVAAQRRIAMHVLVAAQLGAANDIAWGNWQQKERAVPKWLSQAHQAADELIDQEGADEIMHLLVLRKALAASAGMQGKLDPVAWTKEAIKTGRTLIDAADDPWRRARLEWELGLALYDALQADQSRGYHDHALSNSSLVAKYLESALRHRQETPHGAYLVGRLYFRMGTIHAVDLSDHATATDWYAKALPLLQRPLPTTAMADVGRLGESFVSIGISYWETGRRDEAIRITKHGVSLIAQGVKQRVTEEDALAVPYSNLAFMHRELGRTKEAESFAAMATRVGTTRRQ
jgi:tetratricopeptide (TPR) repeat protein